MAGLDPLEQDTDAWATGANQALNALNDGFIPDQTLANGTGVLSTRATFASGTTFTVPDDATAFYVTARRLKIVHAGGTSYCEVASAAFAAGVTTVTIGTVTDGPATMTGPITSVAVGPVHSGVKGNAKVVAPADAPYLVTTAHADLSAEVVVGTTPGGELGGTWAAPTVDATHSGSAHHAQVHGASEHDATVEDLIKKWALIG